MSLPTSASIDAAIPVAGTPSRTLTNAAIKAILAIAPSDIGLGNVNNTSDANKPVSTLQAAAIAAAPGAVSSVASRTGAVTLSAADVGLSNVNNTADSAKPVSTLQAAAIAGAGGALGPYANVAALQTAFPAATNTGKLALAAGVLYYSDGTSWKASNPDRSWGINATPDALQRSLVMTSGAPTLTLSAAGAATALSGSTIDIAGNSPIFEPMPCNSYTGQMFFSDGYVSGPAYIRFATDSQDFEFRLNCNNNRVFNLRVGDQWVQATSINNATSGVFRLRVTFAAKMMRDISITGDSGTGDIGLNGITLSPTDTVALPAVLSPEVWGVMGDSMCVGGKLYQGPSDKGGSSLADMTIAPLQIRRYVVDSAGGSGYIAGGAGNFQGRLAARLLSVTPAITRLLVIGGYNDTGNTVAAIQTAALGFYDAVHAALPNVKIIAATTVNSPSPGTDNATVAIIAAAAARSSFVSVIRADQYITGTGKVGSPTGVGNRDLFISADGVHPAPFGYTQLGLRLAQDILALRAQGV